ncbi:MAG: ABC transporter substrate-binding protein [Patescibacteria group bacterium]
MHIIQLIILYFLSLVYLLIPFKSYVEGFVGQPASFLPSRTQTEIDKTISKLLYRGLFKYDNFGTLIPDLAETWEVSNEGLIYTVTIKDNQFWSDGSKINANDLLYTSYKTPNLSGVATDKIDDLTVRYTLPNKFSPFLSLLTVGVMKNQSDEKYQGFYIPTSGPFRVASVKKKGELVKRVILLDTKSPNIKQLVFRFYPNEEELTIAYKMGEIHAFLLKDTAGFKVDKTLSLKQYPVQSVYYALFFNLRNESFKDLELRNQFEKSLNVDEVIFGQGIPVEGPISRSFYTGEKYKVSNYDKTVSYDLLGKAIKIDVPNTPALLEIANKIKSNWEDKLNANVTIAKHTSDEIKEKIIEARNFDILLYGQEVGRDPDRYVNWHSTQSETPGLNLSGFNSTRGDRALEEGRKELDVDMRLKHYNEFQKVVSENTPTIFLHHPYMNYYVSNKIKGMGDKYTFTLADRFLDFNNWSF